MESFVFAREDDIQIKIEKKIYKMLIVI